MLIVLAILYLPCAYSLIGYDCGGAHLNVTTISLLGTGDCDLNIKQPNVTDVNIQLLQFSQYSTVDVIQCKVEISRTIYHCGMHSHISAVYNGYAEYIHETGYTTCLRMQHEGVLNLGGGSYIKELKPNRITTRSVTLHGVIRNDGTCEGSQYSDEYGTWDAVVVQAVVRITLKTERASVQAERDKIILKTGTVCTFSESYCLDSENGYSYWKPFPVTKCVFGQYTVLYEGPATKITGESNQETPIIYSLTTKETTFSLMQSGEETLCGYTLLRTEHPKLFILETGRGKAFAEKGTLSTDQMDLFSYVNSKFVYVERHLRTQMTNLYHDIIRQKCNLEKEVIQNTLGLATIVPDEFAFRLMKGPGFMAIMAGELIHIIKCIPVEVTIRKSPYCHNELPVTFLNGSYFLTPKSRILTKIGTERECNPLLPVGYRIENTWIKLNPNPEEILPAQELRPMTTLTWKYLTPEHLATSGIYSAKDLEKLRDYIMFPAERPALLDTIARGAGGHPIHTGAISMHHLLDEDSINKIVDNTASRLWKGFVTFGSATAGVFGIFVIIRIVKLIIDTAIHGYALYTIYGWSLHLLGALWSSITHLLVHLAQRPKVAELPNNEATNDTTNEPVVISQPSAPNVSPPDTNVELSVKSRVYYDLQKRLDELERTPSSMGSRSQNGGEV